MDFLVVGTLVSALIAIAQSRYGVFVSDEQLSASRALGLTLQPNDAGATLALGLVLNIGLAYQASSGRNAIRWIIVAVLASGLLLTGSVSGTLSAGVGICVLFLRAAVRPRNLLLMIALVVITVASVSQLQFGANVSPLERWRQTTSGSAESGNTSAARLAMNREAWASIRSSPLVGAGLDEASGRVDDAASGQQLWVHNWLLVAWLKGGVLYMVGVALAVGISLRSGLGLRSDVSIALLAGSLAMFTYAMSAPVMFNRYFWMPMIMLYVASGWDGRTGSRMKLVGVSTQGEATRQVELV